jgi:hypothetical protein
VSWPQARTPLARATGTLSLGALALHELRYLLAPAQGAAAHEHAYMADIVPVIVALATALLATALLAPLSGEAPRAGRRGVAARSLLYAGLMLAVFCAQELAEATLAGAPLEGLATLGAGAWIAAPIALALGAAAAVATRGLETVERRLAAAQRPSRPRRGARSGARGPSSALVRALATDVLAFGIARRPPPLSLRP